MSQPLRLYAFRLAQRLGKTVKSLLDEIDSRELTEWMAFDRIDVSDAWLQSAQLCVVAGQPHTKKNLKLDDFLPRRSKSVVPMSPADIRAKLSVLRA